MKNSITENLCEGVKVIKRKNKFRSIVAIMMLIVVLVLSVIFLAGNLSNVLQVGNFSIFNLFNKTASVSQQKYYAVMLGEGENLLEVTNIATASSELGASGYVWIENGKYYAVGSIYKKRDDAQSVMQNLPNQFNLSIYEIAFKKINLNESENANQLIEEVINYLYTVCENMEDNSKRQEKNEITAIACASFINNYRGELKVLQTKIDYLLSSGLNDKLLKLKNALTQMEGSLGNTISAVLADKVSAMKYGFAEFAFQLKLLTDAL